MKDMRNTHTYICRLLANSFISYTTNLKYIALYNITTQDGL